VAASVTPAIARDVLRRHGLRTKRGLGQHFLVDPNTARRIVRLASVTRKETILEIGPGLGSLTVVLAAVAKRVVAVEIDERVADALSEVLGAVSNVEVIVGDALRADLRALVEPGARLVANLPYNVATPIVMRVLDEVPEITGGLVMVQREVGMRWVSPPSSRSYGATSVHMQLKADARIAGNVPPTVFLPPPKVSSVLVAFERRPHPTVHVTDEAAFVAFVHAAFGHRRKTIRNALVASGLDAADVGRALEATGIDGRSRPEQQRIESLAMLYDELGPA
jgi:16S rRNA (adenine1518-N6/adenine1519-N6)-dimethyltransferase